MDIIKRENLNITSVELVELINEFRKLESESSNKEYKELLHNDFMKKIRKELEVLKSLGLRGEGNISLGSYKDKQNQERPCFILNKDGMLQMLNSESALVRYKTIEYINKLEEENKKLKELSREDELLLIIAKAEDPVERIEATKEYEKLKTEPLKIELGKSKEWWSIKRVSALVNENWKEFDWRKLKETSIKLGYEVKKIFDANYGKVNAYHVEVWNEVYPQYNLNKYL